MSGQGFPCIGQSFGGGEPRNLYKFPLYVALALENELFCNRSQIRVKRPKPRIYNGYYIQPMQDAAERPHRLPPRRVSLNILVSNKWHDGFDHGELEMHAFMNYGFGEA